LPVAKTKPARQFQEGMPVSQGVGTGTRRAMPIVCAGHATWLFWEGRSHGIAARRVSNRPDARTIGVSTDEIAPLGIAQQCINIMRHVLRPLR